MTHKYHYQSRLLDDKQKQEIINLYANGIIIKKIASIYHVRNKKIVEIIRTSNIEYRGKRKYKFNQTFFDTVDTEQKAYILGLLYADGTNSSKRGVVRLQLKSIDIEILEEINKIIENEKPIRLSKLKRKTIMAEIELVSREFSNKLTKLGCPSKKTFLLEFPNENQVPSHLLNHFIRGYFDGDGSITMTKPKKCINYAYGFNIVSTENFCLYLQKLLENKCKVNSYIVTRWKKRNNNTRSLAIGGNFQVKRVLDYLYINSTTYLKRKWSRYNALTELMADKVKYYGCKVVNCTNKHKARGYCVQHYYKFKSNKVTNE